MMCSFPMAVKAGCNIHKSILVHVTTLVVGSVLPVGLQHTCRMQPCMGDPKQAAELSKIMNHYENLIEY